MENIKSINNNGVGHLKAKRRAQASKWFICAMRNFSEFSKPIAWDSQAMRDTLPTSTTQFCFEPVSPPSCPHGAFVYSKVVLLQSVGNNDPERRLATATITYNLALSLHIQGLECSKSALLEKAAFMYRSARSLLASAIPVGCSPSNPNLHLLALAIENNFGQLCFDLGDMETTRKCFTSVRSVLHSYPREYDVRDEQFFFANIAVLERCCGAAAAA